MILKKKFRLLSIALLLPHLFWAQKKEVMESTLKNYKQCLLTKDANLIGGLVAPDFRLGVYQNPIALPLLRDFLKNVPAPDSIFWDKPQTTAKKKWCNVHYIVQQKEQISKVFFAANGLLLYSDWLDKKGFNFDRYGQSKQIGVIPFVYENGSIIVKAQLNSNSKVLNMLFDTGADGLALRADLQNEMGVKITESRTINVPGGQMQVNYSEGNTLQVDGFNLQNQSLVLFPKIKPGVDGLIGGANLFRKYITEIDFENHQIILYSFGVNSKFEKYNATSMQYKNGVPSIPIEVKSKGQTFNSEFIIDAGAGYQAILFGSGTQQQNETLLHESLQPLFQTYNYSMANKSPIKIGLADQINFAGLTFTNASFAVESYDAQKHKEHTVNGSIGIEFLRRFNWVVDLNSYTFYSQKNRYTDLPLDFVVGDYLFGYQNETLLVKRYLKSEDGRNTDANASLKPGDVIESIQYIKANVITKNDIIRLQKETELSIHILRKGKSLEVLL